MEDNRPSVRRESRIGARHRFAWQVLIDRDACGLARAALKTPRSGAEAGRGRLKENHRDGLATPRLRQVQLASSGERGVFSAARCPLEMQVIGLPSE